MVSPSLQWQVTETSVVPRLDPLCSFPWLSLRKGVIQLLGDVHSGL